MPLSLLGPRLAPHRRYRGFPKQLPCLVCGRPRCSTWPGDRIHVACRKARAAVAAAELFILHKLTEEADEE